MRRTIKVVAAPHASSGSIVDTVILDLEQRRTQRGTFVGVSGIRYDVALSEPVLLRMGDLLVLDEAAFVEVVAEAEPLIEVRAKDIDALARMAWQLGDRHVPVEILANRLRLRADAALEKMLASLGARMIAIEAPFNPEGGAYRVAAASGRDHCHDDRLYVHHPHHHGED